MALKQLKSMIFHGKRFTYALIIAIAFLFTTFSFSWAATEAKHYTDLTFPPLADVKLPEYERYVLKNGMVVYLMEDHKLPLVSGSMVIRTGNRFELGNQTGLGSLVGTVMRTGGTKKHSANQLNQMLEKKAATVETSIGVTSGSAEFSALREDLDQVFELFTEVIREPVFAQEKLDLAKTQAKGQIARRNDSPDGIASREFKKLIYGQHSPYARTTEYATLDNISRADLVKFYQQYFHPNHMILGVVGDFEPARMKSLIQARFGEWETNTEVATKSSTLPKVSQAKSNGIFFVNQPQLTQSNIFIGHLGGQFDSQDYPALDVLNGVLNGFGGRLFNEIRTRQGLAYSVYGVWSPRYDYPGIFISGGQTRSDATVQFVKAVKNEVKHIQKKPIDPEELAFAKESTLNSFVFNFQDPKQTLSRLMRYEYYGYPADFLFRYRRAVEATTVADVQRVARKYLQPDKFVTLVVGNQKEIKPPLTNLSAEVQSIDVTIPGLPKPQA